MDETAVSVLGSRLQLCENLQTFGLYSGGSPTCDFDLEFIYLQQLVCSIRRLKELHYDKIGNHLLKTNDLEKLIELQPSLTSLHCFTNLFSVRQMGFTSKQKLRCITVNICSLSRYRRYGPFMTHHPLLHDILKEFVNLTELRLRLNDSRLLFLCKRNSCELILECLRDYVISIVNEIRQLNLVKPLLVELFISSDINGALREPCEFVATKEHLALLKSSLESDYSFINRSFTFVTDTEDDIKIGFERKLARVKIFLSRNAEATYYFHGCENRL